MTILEKILLAYLIAHLSIHALLLFYKILFSFYHSKFKLISYPAAPFFIVCDFLVNMYSMTLLYRERPHEWLVTARLKRWLEYPPDVTGIKRKRLNFALEMRPILNKYDEGHL